MRLSIGYKILLIIAVIAAISPLASAAGETISIGTTTVAVGSDVTLPVVIGNANLVAGGTIKLVFDPTIVHVVSVSAGDFGSPTTNINNAAGFVYVTVSGTSSIGKTSATLVNIKFSGVSAGTTNLDFAVASLNSASGSLITPTVSSGSISVSGPVTGETISIGTSIVAPGSDVTMPVTVGNANLVAGGEIKLVFDPTIVHVVSVSAGDLGSPTMNINNADGFVYVTTSGTSAVGKTSATLANIKFTGVSAGTTNLDFAVASLNSASGSLITPTVSSGSISVSGPVAPVASFTATPTSGTAPLTVTFTDLSTNLPTSWNWNFGDDSTSTFQNPTHTYTSAGSNTVSLTATNAAGSNTRIKTDYIHISSSIGAPLWSYHIGGDSPWMAISSNGKYVAAASTNDVVYYYDQSGNPLWNFTLTTPAITAGNRRAEVSSDGEYVLASDDKTIRYFDKTGTVHWTNTTRGTFLQSAISEDGDTVVTSTLDGKVFFFDSDGKLLNNYQTGDGVYGLAISQNGQYVAVGSFDNNVYLFDNAGQLIWSNKTGGRVNSVAISADGQYIASGGYDSKVYLFSRENQYLWSYSAGRTVHWVSISGDGETIAAASWDSKVHCLNRDGTPRWQYPTLGWVYSVDVSQDGNYVAAGSDDAYIYLLNSDDGTLSWKYNTGYSGSAGCIVSISSNGRYLAASANTGSIYFFDNGIQSAPPIASFSADKTSGTAPLTVTFTDLSTNLPTSWNWNFGDDSTSTFQNPTHTYTSAGSYTVSLTATNAAGSDTKTIANYITVPAIPTNLPTTIGMYRGGVYYLRNSNTQGIADIAFTYGTPTDIPVVGDWDGDGVDTVGMYRNGVYYLRNSNTQGIADIAFTYGTYTDIPVVGDWDGDGIDTVGMYRNGVYYLRNSNTQGIADIAFTYGTYTDIPVVGDWDGDGIDTVGMYRNGVYYLRNSNTQGIADIAFTYGTQGDIPVTGKWI